MLTRRFTDCLIVLPVACALAGAAAMASEPDCDSPAHHHDAESQEKQAQTPEPAPAAPSLDELLGLDPAETDPGADEAAERAREEDLQRRLAGEEAGSALADAIRQMALSAEMLELRLDPGLGTQRVQEEILANLQRLIDAAQRSQSRSSASQSQQQEPSPRDPGQRQQPGREQQRGETAEGSVAAESPGGDEVRIAGSELEETRAEWGALPQRVRDMLLQGRDERFSRLYEQMTRDYYRRLAEE